MRYDVSDDTHLEKFIFAATMGGVGALAENIVWNKIYDTKKTQEDLEALAEEFQTDEFEQLLEKNNKMTTQIEQKLQEIQSKKTELAELETMKQNTDFNTYRTILRENMENLGTTTTQTFTNTDTGSGEAEIYYDAIQDAQRKLEEESTARQIFREKYADLFRMLDLEIIKNNKDLTIENIKLTLDKIVKNFDNIHSIPVEDKFKVCELTPENLVILKSENASSSILKGNCCPRIHRIEYITAGKGMSQEEVDETRNLEKIGDPESYVLERPDMLKRILNILELKDKHLTTSYFNFITNEEHKEFVIAFDEFCQILTLFHNTKVQPVDKKKQMSVCSKSLLESMAILGKLEKGSYVSSTEMIQNVHEIMRTTEKCDKIDEIFSYEIGDLFTKYTKFAFGTS